LSKYKNKCASIISLAIERDQILTKEKWKGYMGTTNLTDLISYAHQVINDKLKHKEITPSTAQTYHNALTHLISMYGPFITFKQTADLPRKLEAHLKKQKLSSNTRKKIHTRVKTILLQAEKEGLPIVNPYAEFTIGTIRGQRSALTVEELKTLFTLYRDDRLPPHLQNTLQYFLFSCLTGCRYSDVAELTHRNIKGTNLVYTPQKTARLEKQIEMRLPVPAYELLHKRQGRLFDVISDQKTNRNLKAILQHVAIDKNITFHSARHTFGTLFIAMGGDVSVLQQLMGHSKIETTSEYLHLAESLKTQTVTVFDEI
jgi:integrase/recombinase XerD